MKYVYFFGAGKADGTGDMKEVLGGKGAGLAEMTRIGLPVPAGFTITTEACDYYLKHDHKYPKELRAEVTKNVARLEKLTGKKLGDAKNPLLVSVRSGSARSMPGMMETILNLGLNDAVRRRPCESHGKRAFCLGCLSPLRADVFERRDRPAEGRSRGAPARNEGKIGREGRYAGDAPTVGAIWSREYKAYFKQKTGKDFPEDPDEQLWGAMGAVFESWMGEKAVTYGALRKLPACSARR